MFVEHYLDPIFPLRKPHGAKAAVNGVQRQANGQSRTNGTVDVINERVEEARSYLDAIVDLDETVPLKRCKSGPSKPLVQIKGRRDYGTAGQVMVSGYGTKEEDVVMAQQARGKTVKELSRLWLYLGGSSPEERRLQDANDRRFARDIASGRYAH